MPAENDPRVFFAAERTLLAWVRTGIAVMGLGFVVARFGLFLRGEARLTGHGAPPGGALHDHTMAIVGVLLVVVAVAIMGIGAVQHARFLRALGPAERPRNYSTVPAVAIAATLSVIGGVLAVALLFWSY